MCIFVSLNQQHIQTDMKSCFRCKVWIRCNIKLLAKMFSPNASHVQTFHINDCTISQIIRMFSQTKKKLLLYVVSKRKTAFINGVTLSLITRFRLIPVWAPTVHTSYQHSYTTPYQHFIPANIFLGAMTPHSRLTSKDSICAPLWPHKHRLSANAISMFSLSTAQTLRAFISSWSYLSFSLDNKDKYDQRLSLT